MAYIKKGINQYLLRWLLRHSDAFIIVNNSLRKYIEKYAKSSALIWVITQFADPVKYTRIYSSKSSSNLLTVSNFSYKEKAEGVIWLIQQLEHFVNEYNIMINFTIIGDGPFLSEVKQKASDLNLKNCCLNISIKGYKSEVSYYYKRAGIFICYSQLDATPNVILEAKAHGLPIIINNFEPFKSLVNDGKSGLFYKDGKEFRKNLYRLITKVEDLQRIGKYSKNDYLKRFTSKAIAAKLEIALEELEQMEGHQSN